MSEWRIVIRDYFEAFRWNRIKESWNKGGVSFFLYIYFIAIFPMNVILQNEESAIRYYAMIIPLLVTIFVAQIHPLGLSKIMFLCPMDETERRRYLMRSWWVRTGFGMLWLVLGCIPAVFLGGASPLGVLGVFLGMSFVICSNGIYAGTVVGSDGVRRWDFSRKGSVGEFIALVTGIILAMGSLFFFEEDEVLVERLTFIGIAVVIEVPLTWKSLKRLPETVAYAMDYEKMFLKDSKKKSTVKNA